MIVYAAGEINGTACPQAGNIGNLTDLINFATCTLAHAVIPLLIGLAVVAFIYGIVKYFLNPDNEEKRKNGKSYMLWGIIALFVMVSFWGIVNIFSSTFGIKDKTVTMPGLPESQSK